VGIVAITLLAGLAGWVLMRQPVTALRPAATPRQLTTDN
jgi:hypothetical protein